MEIRTVWGIVPVPIFYRNKMKSAGLSIGPIVLLRGKRSDVSEALVEHEVVSEALIDHELVHVKQFWIVMLVLAAITSAVAFALPHVLSLLDLSLPPLAMTYLPYAPAFSLLYWIYRSKKGVFIIESAAYAATAKGYVEHYGWSKERALSAAAATLFSSELYSHDYSYLEVLDRVTARFKDGRLF